jgi:hypothetical protein
VKEAKEKVYLLILKKDLHTRFLRVWIGLVGVVKCEREKQNMGTKKRREFTIPTKALFTLGVKAKKTWGQLCLSIFGLLFGPPRVANWPLKFNGILFFSFFKKISSLGGPSQYTAIKFSTY